MLKNPESLFADSSRTQKGRGISFCRKIRIRGNFLAIVSETQKEKVSFFAGESQVIFCRGYKKPTQEGGFLFAGRIMGHCLSPVKETQTGRGVYQGIVGHC